MATLTSARRAAYGAHSPSRRFFKPAVRSECGGVVCAPHPAAAEAGARVLAAGGNAVDAAVCAGLCAGVVEPWMSGPGGGGLMLAHMAGSGHTVAIDGGMVAPAGLDPTTYPVVPGAADNDLFGWPPVAGERNRLGGPAVAVPGLIDGYRLALETLGTRPWAELVEPAAALADAGLAIDAHAALMIGSNAAELGRFAGAVDAFLPGGRPMLDPRAGHRLPQDALAALLRRLAAEGPRVFYEGAPAEALVRTVRAAGGPLAMDDLARFRARVMTPLTADYRGTTVAVAPELNGGPSVLVALDALSKLLCGGSRPPGPDSYVAYAEALRHAFIDRLARMGDVPGRRGLPPELSGTGTGTGAALSAPEEGCTHHISVADADGNLVALTQTLLSLFGARLVVPDSGLLLNNGQYWFDPHPGRPNAPGPGRRPLCNYAPTLVLTHGGGLALGAAGGRRIIGAVTQLVSFLIDHGLNLEGALHQPRLDVSGPDLMTADARLCAETLEALAGEEAALEIRPYLPYPASFGIASVAQRRDGAALGAVEPAHPWAEAVASDAVAAPTPGRAP